MMIDGIKNGIPNIPSVEQLLPQGKTQGVTPAQDGNGRGFSDMLSDAMGEVSELQNQADNKIEGMTTGKGNVTPHEAMIALEKADVAFQLMTTIKQKIVQAYQEVLRTQV